MALTASTLWSNLRDITFSNRETIPAMEQKTATAWNALAMRPLNSSEFHAVGAGTTGQVVKINPQPETAITLPIA